MAKNFTPSDYLRILTKSSISAREVSLIEGCDIKTARAIISSLCDRHVKGMNYTCDTDLYLSKRRGTDRRTELKNIFGSKEWSCL